MDRAQLQKQAARYRGYAHLISDREIAYNILMLASELEHRASQPDEEDVRTRAYDLWKQAGSSEDRDDEFWLMAERQLRVESRSSPLPTPALS